MGVIAMVMDRRGHGRRTVLLALFVMPTGACHGPSMALCYFAIPGLSWASVAGPAPLYSKGGIWWPAMSTWERGIACCYFVSSGPSWASLAKLMLSTVRVAFGGVAWFVWISMDFARSRVRLNAVVE